MNKPIPSSMRDGSRQGLPSGAGEGARAIEVIAPSRLHFGLLSFGHRHGRQFGGVGLMIEQPALCLRISGLEPDEAAAESASTSGFCSVTARERSSSTLFPRVAGFAESWIRAQGPVDRQAFCACRITLLSAPPQHVGLGVGTQLGLAIAAGLNAYYKLPQPKPAELAISAGRGLRSAVGTYGFAQGGLIVERGKLPGETIAPLDCRLDLPECWRVLLIQPPAESGLSGAAEQHVFDNLPPVPAEVTRQLSDELRLRMLPAAARGDFEPFSESVYRYGRLAGMCFASVQGGPYNGLRLERLVERVRALGGRGVGQSSWGPTLFVLLPDPAAADTFKARLAAELGDGQAELLVTPLNQTGARIRAIS